MLEKKITGSGSQTNLNPKSPLIIFDSYYLLSGIFLAFFKIAFPADLADFLSLGSKFAFAFSWFPKGAENSSANFDLLRKSSSFDLAWHYVWFGFAKNKFTIKFSWQKLQVVNRPYFSDILDLRPYRDTTLAYIRGKCVKLICKKQCEMRQIYVQKQLQNAWNLHAKNTAKSAGNPAGYCMAIFYIFQAFSWWFFMELCAGMGKVGSRSNAGVNLAIPTGIALKIFVSAARCQRKGRLALLLGQSHGRDRRRRLRWKGANPTTFSHIFQAFSWWFLMSMCVGMGWIVKPLSQKNG